jgi:uncharacterized damage-inducible protein DinB
VTIAEELIFDFDHEMATTRKVLARVPEQAAGWKPHTKSTAMGELAAHVAGIARWTAAIFEGAETDFMGPSGAGYAVPRFESTARLLEIFDDNVKLGRAAILGASDADMRGKWTLRAGANTIFTLPRKAAVRSFILSHSIHHRGQLSVYLRLNDVPVPSIYGPTADEPR